MAQSWDVKVTVVARLVVPEAVAQTGTGDWQPCQRFSEGQEFIIDGKAIDPPPGFCGWAWADLNRHVVTLARGGSFHGSKPGTTMVACTDGYRPVIFKLERIGDTEMGD